MTEIVCAGYSCDFESDNIADFGSVISSTVNITTKRLTLADTAEITLNNLEWGEGYYEVDVLRSAASGSMNVYLGDNYITLNNDGAVSFNGGGAEAYSIDVPSSIVTVGLLLGSASIAVYSGGVLKGTKTGLTVGTDSFGLLRTTANWYVYGIRINALESDSPNGIAYGIPCVSSGGRYSTQESITLSITMDDIISGRISAMVRGAMALDAAETTKFRVGIKNATDDTAINLDDTVTTKYWDIDPKTALTEQYWGDLLTRFRDKDDVIQITISTDSGLPDSAFYTDAPYISPIHIRKEDD